MSEEREITQSPPWSSTTKLVFGLAFMAILITVVIAFRPFIGPMLLTFVLTYLLHPLAAGLTNHSRLGWRFAVVLVFLGLLVVVIGFSTAAGFVIVQQVQSMINVVTNFVNDTLPQLINDLSSQTYTIGPIFIDPSQLNLENVAEQLLSNLQNIIGQTGTVVSAFASGTLGVFGWLAFILLVSFFLLSDIGSVPDISKTINIPGYGYDLYRLARELGKIWNAYVRGQLFIVTLVMITSATVMTLLGVRFALGIGILTGLARFVPYLGPLIVNSITFLVAFFQADNTFHIDPLFFGILAVGMAMILDAIFDNMISPRILGDSLGVSPAAVLIGALIATNLIGFVGLVLAAPVLASLTLFVRYITRKLFDLDPWPEGERESPQANPWRSLYRGIVQGIQSLRRRFQRKF